LTELEAKSSAVITAVPADALELLESLTLEFSEELQMLYSFSLDSLTKKISFLERAVKSSRQSTIVQGTDLGTPPAAVKSPSVQTVTSPAVTKEAEIVMDYDPRDPVLQSKVSMNFIKTELSLILTTLFDESGYNLVTGSDLKGKVNVQVTDKPLIEVLISLAEANKFDFQIKGGIVTIVPLTREVTEIIKLNYAEAQDVQSLIEPYKDKTGSIKIDKRTNTILINTSLESMRKIKNLLAEIDIQSEKTMKTVRIFSLKYVDPKQVESIINTLKSAEGILQFNPLDGTIVAVDFIENIGKIQSYLEMLDVPVESKQIKTEIYNVRYAKSEDLIKLLQSEVFKQHEQYKNILYTNDTRTNSLILSGNPSNLLSLKRYIKKLDSRIRQVVIAGRIIEVNLDDKHSEGVNWQKLIPRNPTDKDVSEDNLLRSLLFDESSNAYTLAFRFGTLDNEQFNAVLNALKTQSNVKVVSNPTITTLDNSEARILVGEKIPFEETTTTSTGTSSKVTFKDVGITLVVTPIISADNYVTLKVHPEISQQSGTTTSGEPIIGTTEADTQVLIRNGDTLVIGGLVKETVSTLQNKIPLLGEIPGLGRLFKYSQMTKDRVETIIFITPTIVEYEEGSPYEISEYFE
ncbi:MAG: secretin N-terminal domain-containing protein, partial [Candidatus Wallbacteria bacterium]|nr:secretin N-terminal domain-containing protein [Candidatus Wallbacteria bacterium]